MARKYLVLAVITVLLCGCGSKNSGCKPPSEIGSLSSEWSGGSLSLSLPIKFTEETNIPQRPIAVFLVPQVVMVADPPQVNTMTVIDQDSSTYKDIISVLLPYKDRLKECKIKGEDVLGCSVLMGEMKTLLAYCIDCSNVFVASLDFSSEADIFKTSLGLAIVRYPGSKGQDCYQVLLP